LAVDTLACNMKQMQPNLATARFHQRVLILRTK
jgi:hypothetical protein